MDVDQVAGVAEAKGGGGRDKTAQSKDSKLLSLVKTAGKEGMENNGAQAKQAATTLRSVLDGSRGAGPEEEEDAVTRAREQALYSLGKVYSVAGDSKSLLSILDSAEVHVFFASVPKARTAKYVRNLVVAVDSTTGGDLDQSEEGRRRTGTLVSLCHVAIKWADAGKRTFLRQRIESKLASYLVRQGKYAASLELTSMLVKEMKKLDDKQLLVEVHLTQSRAFHLMSNIAKAKSALTAARTNANAIYISPETQGDIDLQAGFINAEERDFNTAYSYFFEAYENAASEPEAVRSLQLMLLCRIMGQQPKAVKTIVNAKGNQKHASKPEIESMVAIAAAFEKRSLDDYEQAREKYSHALGQDEDGSHGNTLVRRLIAEGFEEMMERNLLRVVEPFSRVELAHVAKLVGRPQADVQQRLAQMIIDEKLSGILDQGVGHLVLFEAQKPDALFTHSLEVVSGLAKAVESLSNRAQGVRRAEAVEAKASATKTDKADGTEKEKTKEEDGKSKEDGKEKGTKGKAKGKGGN